MRNFLIGGLCLLAFSFSSLASASQSDRIYRDPGDAWPWGLELPFPWKGIQGVWKAEMDDQDIYFTFRTLRSSDGVQQLQISEYLGNCILIAKGAGFEDEERFVKAAMVGRNGRIFNLTVHVFKQADLRDSKNPEYTEVPGSKTVTVMTMTSVNGKGRSSETFQLQKLNSNPTSFCQRSESY